MAAEKPPDHIPAPNGTNAALTTLASSSNMWVQLATVGLVALTGLSNFAATWKSADRNKEEIVQSRDKIREEVLKQIADIHQWILDSQEEFHKNSSDTASARKILVEFKEEMGDFERRQLKLLENQNANEALLIETHKQVVELNQMRHLDQMRGAPNYAPSSNSTSLRPEIPNITN